MIGQLTDISHLCEFKFYKWIKYKRVGVQFPFATEQLGRCLGPAVNQGSRMCQYVLADRGNVMSLQTLRRLTMKGHELLCQWKDGTSSWVHLCELKDSYPIETAEFAVHI